MDVSALERGQMLDGYRVVSLLETDGETAAYAADQIDLGRRVRLHVAKAGAVGDALLARAQALLSVADPHLLPVYDARAANDVAYAVGAASDLRALRRPGSANRGRAGADARGVSTRRYARTQEPVGVDIEKGARSTSKSAVSRAFVERTREALAELMSRRLDDLRLAVMMLDGIELKRRTNIVALGITTDGVKLPLGLWATGRSSSRR